MWDIIDSARNDTVYIVNCEIISIANREQLNFLNVYHSRCCSKVQYTHIRVHLNWTESESKGNIVCRWIYRGSSFMFTLSSDKEQRISSLLGSLSLSQNEPLMVISVGSPIFTYDFSITLSIEWTLSSLSLVLAAVQIIAGKRVSLHAQFFFQVS